MAKECGEVFITPLGKRLHCRIKVGHETGKHPEHACHDDHGFYKFSHANELQFFFKKFLNPGDMFPHEMGNTYRPT